MVVRVTVTLPEDVLGELDAIAQEEGVTRSEIVREAAAGYVTRRSDAAEVAERGRAVVDGIRWLETVASHPDREEATSSLEVLRELRGSHPAVGAPLKARDRRGGRT